MNAIAQLRSEVEPRAPETLLSDCARRAVRAYLVHMGGHPLTDLHAKVVAEVEKPLLQSVMDYTKGNQTQAAQILGLSRGTLRKKLIEYQLIDV